MAKKQYNTRVSRRWVIKAGSQMVCAGGPLLIRDWMRQVADLRVRHNIEVIWVTSGAIATAVDLSRAYQKVLKTKTRSVAESQALSAIGQPLVMELYNLALQAVGLSGAQILLSYDDLINSQRRQNFKNTIEQLITWNVVPILNENDAVATDEIRFGDNDALSAKVASEVNADRLVILTDVAGLYSGNPNGAKSKNVRLIEHVAQIDETVLQLAESGAKNIRGTGGMLSKLRAAQIAQEHGISSALTQGDVPSVLVRLAQGENVGTLIGSRIDKRSSSKK